VLLTRDGVTKFCGARLTMWSSTVIVQSK
jgi:hypothetical protein